MLLHAGREDTFSVELDLDAQRRTEVGALDDGTASEDVSRQGSVLEWIKERAATRVADHGMSRLLIAVFRPKLL